MTRFILILATNLSAFYAMLCLFLGKRRLGEIAGIYLFFKAMIVNVIMNQIYGEYVGKDPVFTYIYVFTVGIAAILNFIVFCYVFDGGILKIILVSTICEILAGLLGGSLTAIVNIIEGNHNIWEIGGRLKIQDGLIPVAMFGIYTLFYFLFGEKLKRIRKYQLKHKKVWAVIAVIWIGFSIITMIPDYNDTLILCVFVCAVGSIVWVMLLVMIGMHIWQSYRRQLRQEHSYLVKQSELMSLYHEAIIQQIWEIEKMHQIMNAQMEEIQQIKAEMTQKKRIKKYLEMLHHQYRTIQPGTFSDDMTVDAILYYYGNTFQKKGIELEASFSGYKSGSVDEVCIGKILMCLMETAAAEIVVMKTK